MASITSPSWSEIVRTSTRVRGEIASRLDRVGAGARLGDHVDPLLLEQVAEPRPEQVVVVHEEDAERVALAGNGEILDFGQRHPLPLPRPAAGAVSVVP